MPPEGGRHPSRERQRRIANSEFRMKKVPPAAFLFFILYSLFAIRYSAAQTAFAPALPGYEFSFPRDHGSHDGYRTEWWYYTGHLRADDGHVYGFELTFFRVGGIRFPRRLQRRVERNDAARWIVAHRCLQRR